LIITVPTIAAALWQGNMGTFMAYSAFNNTAAPGPQGQPAGSYMPQQVAKNEERSAATNSQLHSQGTRVTQTSPALLTQPVGSRGQAGKE
ncbi:Type IV secretion system protein virB6, partial [Xanthomonas nasturtii]|nr:Type IV secretion system protein virB6 [Xanthomonas nasturtii]